MKHVNMQRMRIFILVVASAFVALVASAGTFAPHGMMMSGMMEGSGMGVFIWPTILAVSSLIALVGIVYVVAFPEIKNSADNEPEKQETGMGDSQPLDIVMRFSKPDERVVLQILSDAGGVCLQKDITLKSGFSKLRTHRILARLTQRGVIEATRTGRTNEIRLPGWLSPQFQNQKKS